MYFLLVLFIAACELFNVCLSPLNYIDFVINTQYRVISVNLCDESLQTEDA